MEDCDDSCANEDILESTDDDNDGNSVQKAQTAHKKKPRMFQSPVPRYVGTD